MSPHVFCSFLPSASWWAKFTCYTVTLKFVIWQFLNFIILSSTHLLNDCEKQSIVINVFCNTLRKKYVLSQEFQWENALEILTLVCMVKIGHTLLFSPKSVVPLMVIYSCSLNLLSFNSVNGYWFFSLYYHVIFVYEHILLIMISLNFYHSDTFHFVLKKKTKKLWLSSLNYLIYCQYLKVSYLLKLVEDATCYRRFVIDEKIYICNGVDIFINKIG